MHAACHEMRCDGKLFIPKELCGAVLAKAARYSFRVWELAVSFLGRLAMLS